MLWFVYRDMEKQFPGMPYNLDLTPPDNCGGPLLRLRSNLNSSSYQLCEMKTAIITARYK